MKTIGERIKQRREELGLSQDELAKKLGYKSRSSINKIEIGSQRLIQSKIKAIADALDTTPSYIMGWNELDDSIDIKELQEGIANEQKVHEIVSKQYGEDVWDALCMYIQLDTEDRAEVRGMMKGLYRSKKYSAQAGLKNA